MLIIDAHLDLAMNALYWNRDLTQNVQHIRESEQGMTQKGRALGTVALPDMRTGNVGVSIATLIARVAREGNPMSGYNSPEIAYAHAQGQLDYYRILQSQGQLQIITEWPTLSAHVQKWESADGQNVPLGIIISMEGADPILSPDTLENWWADGLRIIGLSHYGVSRYAHGTGTSGGLTPLGRPMLSAMSEIGMILDLTHLADESFWEAIDAFEGAVLASHNNCRSLVPGGRQFTDEQVQKIIERDGVIGAAMDAWMLYPGWVKGETSNTLVSLETVIDHMDHICQLAGNARHVAIGTDLDGGYGYEQTPHDLETIADLQKLPNLLRNRGYSESDIKGMMHGNWLRLLRDAWTEGSD